MQKGMGMREEKQRRKEIWRQQSTRARQRRQPAKAKQLESPNKAIGEGKESSVESHRAQHPTFNPLQRNKY